MLTAFTASLLLITISEIGDKSFFIAMLLSMRHKRRLVFAGVVAALAVMTVLSVLMGQIFRFLPERYVDWLEITLFLVFGFKLLRDAYCMASGSCSPTEQKEAEEAVEHCEAKLKKRSMLAVITQAFVLTFLTEWGDRTQFATIALAASNNAYGVTSGAILGHAVCAAIAVIGGRMVAGRISERMVTALGGALFLVFAIVAGMEMA
ncbi:MAG: TMEM165/GDT1 family protein [Microcoleus sp. SIO2G3]|nr:TMEM165/GDT1 family protein [Microcoleus sp. SIO2G3]